MIKKMMIVGVAGLLLSACSDATNAKVPKVASAYKEGIARVWEVTEGGKSPSSACAVVVGTAVGHAKTNQGNKADAIQAYKVCYVDAFVNYANVFMAMPENAELDNKNKPNGCLRVSTAFGIHSMSIGMFANDLGLEPKDLVDEVNAGLGDTAKLCPPLKLLN